MKKLTILFAGTLILIVLISGCASTQSPAPATTAAMQVTQTPSAAPVTTVATQAPTITGTTWKLGWFDDTKGVWSKVAEGSTITASFGTDNQVKGSGGCNAYSAEYRLGTDPKIWIRRPEIGSKTCQSPLGVMSQESYYYTDLSLSEDFKISNGQLVMYDQSGKKILQFDPA